MNYSETILQLANNLLVHFDEVYHSVEIISNDKAKRFPGVSVGGGSDWINLAPSDQHETVYIRRNGDDEFLEDLRLSSCGKAYRMRSSLRIIYHRKLNTDNHGEILFKLMQSVLIGGTKLKTIIRDKWKLKKEESSGDYNFVATTAYFAVDIYALWDLLPDTCEQDFCADIINPLKKESCLVAVPES